VGGLRLLAGLHVVAVVVDDSVAEGWVFGLAGE
jgi:hypothetical protein